MERSMRRNPWPLPPPHGQTLSQGPVEVGALCLTACHCAMVVISFSFFSAGDGV